MNLWKFSFEEITQQHAWFADRGITRHSVLAIAFAFDLIMFNALRSYSYKCLAEFVAFCFACLVLASSHRAYKTTTIATLNTKL